MYINRFNPNKNWKSLRFNSSMFLQSAELNEMQSIQSHELSTIASSILEDGSLLRGGGIFFKNGIAKIDESLVFAMGYTISLPYKELSVTENCEIGFVVEEKIISSTEDISLLGGVSSALNEEGAERLVLQGEWTIKSDSDLPFFSIFTISNGVLSSIKHIAPELEGMRQIVGRYDYDSNGSYVVDGLVATYEGEDDDGHILSISDGTAHVNGLEMIFEYSQKIKIDKMKEYGEVESEPFTFKSGSIYRLRHYPLRKIEQIIGTFEREETLTHGSYFGVSDRFSFHPVLKIISVKQGSKVFVTGRDYTQDADSISWSLNGAEPAPGSSYVVRYQYSSPVKSEAKRDSFSLSGLVEGSYFYVTYSYFLKRIDRLLLTSEDGFVVLRGDASEYNALPPSNSKGLSLATVEVSFNEKPTINVDFFKAYKKSDIQTLANRLDAMEYNISRLSLDSSARSIDPTTDKKEIFVDPFLNDDLRDKGIAQNAVIENGVLKSEIEWKEHQIVLENDFVLPFSEETIVEQEKYSKSRLVNAYIEKDIPSNEMKITPSVFRWVAETSFSFASKDSDTISLSTKTQVVPQTKIEIVAQTFTNEWVKIYIDGHYVKRVRTVKGLNGHYEVKSAVLTPKNIMSGAKLVKVVGESSKIVVEGVWHTLAQKRVVTFRWRDPLAQTILLKKDTFVSSLSLFVVTVPTSWFKIHIVQTSVGIPNMKTSLVSKVFDAKEIKKGWSNFRFDTPIFLEKNMEYAIVVECGDAKAQVGVAEIGKYDKLSKRWISKSVYSGVLLSSSNSSSWTAYQKEDLSFRLYGASFKKSVSKILGSFSVNNTTDFGLLGAIENEVGTNARFFLNFTKNGKKIPLALGGSISVEEYSGEVTLTMEFTTSYAHLTPVLHREIVLATGKAKDSTYVSRQFVMSGTSIKVYLDIHEAGESEVEVYAQAENGSYVKLEKDTQENRQLGGGFTESCFVGSDIGLRNTRIKIVFKNNGLDRPLAKNLRAIIH